MFTHSRADAGPRKLTDLSLSHYPDQIQYRLRLMIEYNTHYLVRDVVHHA